MTIREATKEDIFAMSQRIRNAQAELQIDAAIRMVNKHRKEVRSAPREEVFIFDYPPRFQKNTLYCGQN